MSGKTRENEDVTEKKHKLLTTATLQVATFSCDLTEELLSRVLETKHGSAIKYSDSEIEG